MFELTGRIITIHRLSDKLAQVVVKKTIKGKPTPIAVNIFGLWKDKFDALKLQKNDKIVGRVFLKSNLYKNKWYTDFYFNEVKRFVPKPKYDPYTNSYQKPINKDQDQNLFDNTPENIEEFGGGYMVDEETGEIKF